MIDIRTHGAVPDGATDCVAAINAALVLGDTIIQEGFFAIASAILIPSNRTLYIKNARLKQLDSTFDNCFRNSDVFNGNENVKVIGLGHAVIDGNAVGNDAGADYEVFGGKTTTAHSSYKKTLFYLSRVDGFEVSGIEFVDRPCYVGMVMRSSNGVLKNFFFNAYSETQNQDGIATSYGSHDVVYDNWLGYVQDSIFSVFLGGKLGAPFVLPYNTEGDAYNLTYSNIRYTGYYSIAWVVGEGNRLHDVACNNITQLNCQYFAYFGYESYLNESPSQDDFKDMSFDNLRIVGNVTDQVMDFRSNCKNITFTNFVNESGKDDVRYVSGTQSNVTINGVDPF